MLSEARAKIDTIDQQIVELIEERLEIVQEVAKIKATHDLSIYDGAREAELLKKVRSYCTEEDNAESIASVFLTIMAASKEQQRALMGKVRE